GQHDDIGLDLHRFARERQRITNEIGDAIINFRRLIVMRQDDRATFRFQLQNRIYVGGVDRPLRRRNRVADLGKKILPDRREVISARQESGRDHDDILALSIISSYAGVEHKFCQEREMGSFVPTIARSVRISRRNRNSFAGLPPVSWLSVPVSSTSCCCSMRRRKFCLCKSLPARASTQRCNCRSVKVSGINSKTTG